VPPAEAVELEAEELLELELELPPQPLATSSAASRRNGAVLLSMRRRLPQAT
jgi:hypothetical protein